MTAKLTVEEFLSARLDALEIFVNEIWQGPAQEALRALIKSQRELIEIHRNWPYLIETQPQFKHEPSDDPERMTFSMVKSILWITRDEYTKRFGPEAPTAPFIKSMLLAWRDHKDFDELWLNGHR